MNLGRGIKKGKGPGSGEWEVEAVGREDRGYRAEGDTHIGRVHVTLDDVEDRDIARGFTGCRGDHAVLGLEETPHDVEDCCLAYGLGL